MDKLYNFYWGDRQNDGRDKRKFSETQKKEILDQQRGFCAGEYCGHAKLDLRIVEFHHMKGWAKQGETRIENGVAVCPNCHALIHYFERLNEQEEYQEDEEEDNPDPFDHLRRGFHF